MPFGTLCIDPQRARPRAPRPSASVVVRVSATAHPVAVAANVAAARAVGCAAEAHATMEVGQAVSGLAAARREWRNLPAALP